jgi:adenylosuccinate synthase
MCDLLDATALRQRVQSALEAWAPTIVRLGGEVPALDPIVETYAEHGRALAPLIGDATGRLQDAIERAETVIAEGAQGSLLDVDHGTYPYVTSSTVLASGAATGLGIGPTAITSVVGITKAYATRVGSGPFPTELHDDIGRRIREAGGEFGSVTGRPRRCGWLDLVALRHAARLNGMTEMIMTKADVLQGLDVVRVCVAYEVDGVRTLRADPRRLGEAIPVYEELPGFQESLGNCRRAEDLPGTVRRIVDLAEAQTGVGVTWLSVGPGREQSIRLR